MSSTLTELDVINAMLAGIGIAPRTSLTRPDRYTASGIQKLKRWSTQVQARRWWFNDHWLLLTPDPDDAWSVASQLPCNVLALEGPVGRPVSIREPGYLLDLMNGEPVKEPLKVRVTSEVPFAELPVVAQFFIQDCAVLDFVGHMDGSRTDLDRMLQSGTGVQLKSEDTRMRKANLLHSPEALNRLALVSQGRWNRRGIPTR